MLGKVLAYTLGTVFLVIFGLLMFWEPFMEGVTAANTSYPAGGNYTGLNETIRATPLLFWAGVLATPVVCTVLYLYARRQGAV